MQRDGFEADVGTDEVFELVGRNFTQSLESRDFGVGTQPLDGCLALFLGIAVDGFELRTVGLAALFVIHIIYAFWLTMQNRAARGHERYAVTAKPKNVEWASQNMLVLGIIVILGLALHFVNFWYKMQFAEIIGNPMMGGLHAADGYGYIMQTFSNPVFFVLYIIWLIALWFHLTHGFWSSMQTLGWNNTIWINRWKCISNIYSTIIVLGFMLVAVVFFLKNMMGCGAC